MVNIINFGVSKSSVLFCLSITHITEWVPSGASERSMILSRVSDSLMSRELSPSAGIANVSYWIEFHPYMVGILRFPTHLHSSLLLTNALTNRVDVYDCIHSIISWENISICFTFTSLSLGESYDIIVAREATLGHMDQDTTTVRIFLLVCIIQWIRNHVCWISWIFPEIHLWLNFTLIFSFLHFVYVSPEHAGSYNYPNECIA